MEEQKPEEKKLSIGDVKKLAGSKSVASFARFVVSPEQPKETLTVHEVNALSGGRAVASFTRFVASGGEVVAENKDSQEFGDVNTVEEFDELERRLRENAKYKEETS